LVEVVAAGAVILLHLELRLQAAEAVGEHRALNAGTLLLI
jgi:hypothetical protein